MQNWKDKFQSHTIHQTIKDLEDVLDEIALSVSGNDEIIADLERVRQSEAYIKARLANCIIELVSGEQLDNLNHTINNSAGELRLYKNDQNIAHIGAANHHISNSVHSVNSFPFLLGGKGDKAITSLVANAGTRLNKILDAGVEQKKVLESEIEQLQKNLATVQTEVKNLSENLKQQKDSIENFSTDYQRQFSDAQEKRRIEFSDKVTELQDKITATLKDLADKVDEEKKTQSKQVNDLFLDFRSKADDFIKSLEGADKKASRLLEAVGIKSHSYGYAATAKAEADAAKLLRRGAIGLMLLAIGILVGPAIYAALATQQTVDWFNVLYRLPTTIVIFVPGFYLAREAAKHRAAEIENKRIELEMAALMPYLELMPDEEKTRIKERLINNYFIGHKRNDAERPDKQTLRFIERVLPKILDKVIDRIPNWGASAENENK